MTYVVANPAADALIEGLAVLAMQQWGELLLEEMDARVHEETGQLAASLRYDGPDIVGAVVRVVHHDGPGAGGKTYGAAEEVMRGGLHAFMRPALDFASRNWGPIVLGVFGGGGTATSGPAGLPRPAGGWQPIPGGKVYTF